LLTFTAKEELNIGEIDSLIKKITNDTGLLIDMPYFSPSIDEDEFGNRFYVVPFGDIDTEITNEKFYIPKDAELELQAFAQKLGFDDYSNLYQPINVETAENTFNLKIGEYYKKYGRLTIATLLEQIRAAKTLEIYHSNLLNTAKKYIEKETPELLPSEETLLLSRNYRNQPIGGTYAGKFMDSHIITIRRSIDRLSIEDMKIQGDFALRDLSIVVHELYHQKTAEVWGGEVFHLPEKHKRILEVSKDPSRTPEEAYDALVDSEKLNQDHDTNQALIDNAIVVPIIEMIAWLGEALVLVNNQFNLDHIKFILECDLDEHTYSTNTILMIRHFFNNLEIEHFPLVINKLLSLDIKELRARQNDPIFVNSIIENPNELFKHYAKK